MKVLKKNLKKIRFQAKQITLELNKESIVCKEYSLINRCEWRITTETGRLFFRRRTKQLPLARKPNVLGHGAKRT